MVPRGLSPSVGHGSHFSLFVGVTQPTMTIVECGEGQVQSRRSHEGPSRSNSCARSKGPLALGGGTTRSDDGWMELEPMSDEECIRRLHAAAVGRVGISMGALP